VRFTTIVAATILFSSFSLFSNSKPIDFENFFGVYRLAIPVVSADGRYFAVEVKKADMSENNFSTQIWLARTSGTDLKQLTTDPSSNSNPVFSPDGKTIYFLSDRSGSSQVWQIPLNGGEAQQVSNLYGDIDGFIVSPYHSHFLFQRKVPPDCENEDCIKQKGAEKEKADSESTTE